MKTYLKSSVEGAVNAGEESDAGNLNPIKFGKPVPTEGPSGETHTKKPYMKS